MQHYVTRLIAKKEVAKNTMSFVFERPAGFDYQAGQFIGVLLDSLGDVPLREKLRSMSLGSAPYEQQLSITMRMSESPFKRTLAGYEPGQSFTMQGPFGRLVLPPEPSAPLVFLAGGIGIVPFRGMVWQMAHDGWQYRVILFYSNRYQEEATFMDEFAAMSAPQFTFIPTFTNSEREPLGWPGEFGRIDVAKIQKYLAASEVDPATALFYIVGVPDMVRDLKAQLTGAGIAEAQVKAEYFTGYK